MSNVVLWDIHVNKRRNNKTLNENSVHADWSLQEYYNVAKRCIGVFAAGQLAQSMLRDEDAISFVAEHLMYASYRWKESGGRTINSYLNQCAIWSIQRWVVLIKRATKYPTLSLNVSLHPEERTQRHEMISDISIESPDKIMASQEQADNLTDVINNAGLTERQRHCLEAVYIQGQKKSEVARNLGVSRQAVDQCLTKGVTKIKVAIDGKETLFT